MKQVKGSKDWWEVFKDSRIGNATYKQFKNGKETGLFIEKEENSHRRFFAYKYEVFRSGAGVNGTAGYLAGSRTLKGAIALTEGESGNA